MENSIGIANDAERREVQHVDGEVSELTKKDPSVDGFKDTDEDEVFEKAIESQTPKIDSESSRVIDDVNTELIGTLENGEDNTNPDSEVQKLDEVFEEVIEAETPAIDSESSDIVEGQNIELKKVEENPNPVSEIQKPSEVFEEAIEADIPMVDSENSKIIEGGDVELLGTLNNDDHYSSLMSEIQKFEEMNGGTEAAQGSEHSSPSSEILTSEEHPVETQSAAKKLLKNEANALLNENKVKDNEAIFEELLDSSSVEVNNELDNSPQNGVSDNAISVRSLTNEDSDTVDADTGEKSIVDMLETQESHELNEAEAKTADIEGNIHEMPGIQDANEVKVGDIGSVNPENGLLDRVNVAGTSNDGSTNIGEVEGSVKGSESGPTKSNGDVIHNNEENAIVSDCGPRSESESDGGIMHKDENELGSEGAKFQKVSPATDHVEQKFVHDTSLPPVVEDGTGNLETEKVEKVVDASIEVPNAVALEPEKGEINDESKEKHISGITEQEVVPVTGVSPSSGEGHEAVSQAKPVNVEQESKTAADISSSSKSATVSRPAGLGHTATLLESTQKIAGSKENGSKSAANNLPSAAPARPAGLGRAALLLEPTSRVAQQPRVNGAISATQNQLVEDQTNGDAEEYDETREKLQMIRVKFLRLAHRLGQTPHNVVVAQVLYRLGLAEQLRGRSGGRVGAFSFDRASAMAEQLEAAGQEPLDFTCTIMVLGKSGVGKSATINSIFDEVMFDTDAFQLGTKKVQDIVGTVQGIRVRVIDTPGLLPSLSDQRHNEKILRSVKKFINKTPPDIVLYLDRLDMQSRDSGDMPLLRTITQVFGPSIWFNAIVVLTHAASAPPEGPNGTATSYDMFVTQRSHVVQQAIRQAAGDMRLMNPVSLVENHSACRTNRAGQRVLPNGQVWKPHLLLLSFASKILAEANTLLKLQDSPPGRPFAPRTRSPPLPFLLSSLLQSRPEVKLPSEQFGDDDDAIDDDVDEDSESEDDEDYDELPAFKSLSKAQLEKLPKSQKKAYYDELEYREKLFMKKQLKEEKKRRKMMKKMAKDLQVDYGENPEEESGGAASVPVPMPDLTLPASFDSDNPTHRYRSLDSNPWLIRAVLEPNGWDHDIGYDGINVERLFVVKEKVPISFSGHISKDKKDANLQMEIASSVKHGKGKATSFGFDAQSAGKDMAYTVRSETKFSNHKINKASAGCSATLLGDILTGGAKIENKLSLGKRGELVVSGGGIYGRGDIAFGGSLEATLRDKDHPLGRFLSTLGISVMEWHGDLAIGCNSQTQIPIGRYSNLIARFNVNNRGSGQVSVRVNSSEQLQIVLIGLIPLIRKIIGT